MQGTFEWDADVEDELERTFGLQTFRPLQREVINCTMSGRHCLCLMPSGGKPCDCRA
jgi:ATP-dependent DNA helicase RecQ